MISAFVVMIRQELGCGGCACPVLVEFLIFVEGAWCAGVGVLVVWAWFEDVEVVAFGGCFGIVLFGEVVG